jgi:hypothetical protein
MTKYTRQAVLAWRTARCFGGRASAPSVEPWGTGDQEIFTDHCKELSRWAAMRESTPAQEPEQRSPKSRNCRYPDKEQRQAREGVVVVGVGRYREDSDEAA